MQSATATIVASAPISALASSSVPSGMVASAVSAAAILIQPRPIPSVRRNPTSQTRNSAVPIASSNAIRPPSGSYGSPTAFLSPAATATMPSSRP